MLSRAAGTPEGLAGQPQIGDHGMPFRARIMASVALATASFLIAPSALALMLNTLVTVEGTDVFTVVNLSGTNDPVSASLMLKLVNRVKKLR